MKYLSLLISAFALSLGACERHSWEDQKDENGIVTEKGTKRLYPAHHAEGADHGAGEEAHGAGDRSKEGGDHGNEGGGHSETPEAAH